MPFLGPPNALWGFSEGSRFPVVSSPAGASFWRVETFSGGKGSSPTRTKCLGLALFSAVCWCFVWGFRFLPQEQNKRKKASKNAAECQQTNYYQNPAKSENQKQAIKNQTKAIPATKSQKPQKPLKSKATEVHRSHKKPTAAKATEA